MSKNNIPFFEINGNRYEIKRNRYLQAEFEEMKKGMALSEDEQILLAKENEFLERVEKLKERKDELYNKYLETFDEKDEEIYNKACVAYDRLIEETKNVTSVSAKQKQELVNIGERLIIKAIEIDKDGNTIRTQEEAKSIWEDFVMEFGKANSIEFVIFTINYIIGGDDDMENPFLTQAKAKAEQKASMKKGISKAR